MDTRLQYSNDLKYNEVYFSDLVLLKQIFMQMKDSNIINEDFGLPFLLAKKADAIVAFASLIIDEHNKIDFVIYESKDLNVEEKKGFRLYVEDYFRKSPSDNYRDPEQLKSTTSRIISWING